MPSEIYQFLKEGLHDPRISKKLPQFDQLMKMG